jgi:hypothetical protein
MAKMSLLEMTQNILNDMESDSVSSIDDTEESIMVAAIIKQAYADLCSIRDWPFLRTLGTLEGLADTDQPTTMRIPEGTNKIFWIKYNKKNVTYLDPKDFKDMIDARNVDADNVDADGYITDKDPTYWTTYDDKYVVFDSLDLDDEITDTLHQSKTAVYSVIVPTWTHEDDFTPLLPEKMFPTLLADAKGTAFLNLKQQANAKEETKARKGRIRAQNEAWRADAGETGTYNKTNYGRK